MHTATQLTLQHTARPAETFGRIARTFAANEDHWMPRPAVDAEMRSEAEAWALHASATSGFGDSGVDMDPVGRVPVAPTPETPFRDRVIGATTRALQTLQDRTTSMVDEFRRQMETRATYRALRDLDARTLRDLGIDRSEILSVALEVSRTTEPTRIRTTRADRTSPKASLLSRIF